MDNIKIIEGNKGSGMGLFATTIAFRLRELTKLKGGEDIYNRQRFGLYNSFDKEKFLGGKG